MPRIAVLSTAHIHSEAFLKYIQANTSAGAPHLIWDQNQERGQEYVATFGGRFEPNLEAALADEQVDGFLICAENTRHMALLEHVLPLGKPVLCEKPLTTSSADAQRVAELVAQHGTPLCSGYFMPFDTGAQGLIQLLADETLGAITHVAHRNAHSAAYGRWFDNPKLAWFTEPELSAGGALLDLGTHSVHFLRSLFGPVESVSATVATLSGAYPEVDDYGSIMLKFRSGVIGRVEAGWIQQAGPKGLEIFGDKAALWPQDGFRYGSGNESQGVPAGTAKPDRVARLIALIKGEIPEAEWRADLEAALDAVSIIEAAYRSSASGSWQTVSDCLVPATSA
ncbi:MAG: Gfo/Idh/MocA family oxidoreductase [Planctomycetota bacterium]|jgi:predicted dehydrogenase|nr:Gfo/Idh/MocA family oxidoreductase [Planctomycetota bacterium]